MIRRLICGAIIFLGVLGLSLVGNLAFEFQLAEACSPPPIGFFGPTLSDVEGIEVPKDGVLAVGASATGADWIFDVYTLEIEVKDSEGAGLEGGFENVKLTEPQLHPWYECVLNLQGGRFHLLVWEPDGEFVSGQEYVVNSTFEFDELGGRRILEESAEFTAVDDIEATLGAPDVESVELAAVTEGADYKCCRCDGCCYTACSIAGEGWCWYVSEKTRPMVEVEIAPQPEIPAHQVLYRIHDEDGEVLDKLREPEEPVELVFDESEDGEYCLSVSVEHLASGDVEVGEEVCVEDQGEFEFGEESIDWSWSSICVDPPPDEADSDPGDDVGVAPDAGGDGGGGNGCGGCVAGGGAPVPVAVVLVTMGWAFVRRGEA